MWGDEPKLLPLHSEWSSLTSYPGDLLFELVADDTLDGLTLIRRAEAAGKSTIDSGSRSLQISVETDPGKFGGLVVHHRDANANRVIDEGETLLVQEHPAINLWDAGTTDRTLKIPVFDAARSSGGGSCFSD